MSKKRMFGELQLAILQLFQNQARFTVRDVLRAMGEQDKYTTIMTVMNRLVEKKQLCRVREGQQYVYWASAAMSIGFLHRWKQKVFGGKTVPLVSYLLSEEISDAELEEMEKLIQDMRQARRES